MLVRFWGTRGSIPAPLKAEHVRRKVRRALVAAIDKNLDTESKIDRFMNTELSFVDTGTYGGNSSCVELDIGAEPYFLCDLGSGAREFGNYVIGKDGPKIPNTYNVFMSHVHWDHIMGFPFFTPSFIPGNKIRIHGCHENMEEAFRRQHGDPSFPLPFEALAADIEFIVLEPDKTYDMYGMLITTKTQHHGGGSYGYRFEYGGKTLVYSTDSEHKFESIDDGYDFVKFFENADAVVFDAMYSLADAISLKEDWGHSSNIIGVELCHMAGAKNLVMFHHEPAFNDLTIDEVLQETIRFEEISREGGSGVNVLSAYDGMELHL